MTGAAPSATGMSLGELRFRRYHRAERLTRSGFLFFLAIVGIGAVAINSGNNLLYLVFSALLSALIFSGFLSVANLRHVDVALEAADDVIMGRPARLVVRVRNAGSFPLFFATVRMRDGQRRPGARRPVRGAPVDAGAAAPPDHASSRPVSRIVGRAVIDVSLWHRRDAR